MKSCSNNRELIAGLALGALDARQERGLRVHLETCAECRRYLQEMSRVTQRLAAAEIRSDIQTSERFHDKWTGKMGTQESAPVWAKAWARIRESWLNWLNQSEPTARQHHRLTLIGSTVGLIAVLAILVWRPGGSSRVPTAPPTLSTQNLPRNADPTILNYQVIASHSLEDLDALLARQANQNALPAPVYSAIGFSRPTELD